MKKIFHAGVFFISAVVVGMFINLFFGFGVGIAYAETEISSSIDTDTTWNLEGSPYIVKSGIAIYEGATLTVEPGVEVKFDNGSMAVFGSLQSDGTTEQTVSFSSALPDQDWGIFFRNSTSSLSHTMISGSSHPIFGMDSNLKIDHLIATGLTGPITFSSSTVDMSASDFSHGGKMLELYNNSNVTVSDSVFHDAVTNDYDSAIVVYDSATLALQNVTIEQVTGGNALAVYAKGSISISSSTIAHGSGSGILTYKDAVVSLKNSTISDFAQDGILAYLGAQVSLDRSSLIGNDKGLEIYTPIDFHAEASDIYDNKTSGIDNTSGSDIDAKNVWWGDAAGPHKETDNSSGAGNSVSNGVIFDPWLAEDPLVAPTPKCCSNVAFIPGLEGSRLYTNGFLSENQLWEPNRNADVEKLYLDVDGKSINKSVYTRDIINNTNYGIYDLDIYKSFSDSMNTMVSDKTINAWKALPYDWRLDYDNIIANGIKISDTATSSLVNEIKKLAANSKTGKVTIVAHSNGGLLAKNLINELSKEGKSNLIDNLILVAVPQLGTPQSLPAILHGYGQSLLYGLLLNPNVARTLAKNMSTAYNLLPSDKYITQNAGPLVTLDLSIDSVSNLRKIYGDTINDPTALSNFLLGTADGRGGSATSSDVSIPSILNANLLTKAKNVHQDLDNWSPPSDIVVSQIVGWGLDTVDGLKYQKKTVTVCTPICYNKDILDYRPMFDFHGDGTVMKPSAEAMTAQTYYVNLAAINNAQKTNRAHGDILETDAVQNLVKNIVGGQQMSLPDNVLTSLSQSSSQNNLQLSVHSPVSLNLFDVSGNHTGPISNPNQASDLSLYEAKIPNSYYLPFGEGVYAGVNNPGTTNISLQGTGVGTFTLELNDTSFADIPVLPTTVATLVYSSATTSSLAVDLDGDGKVDMSVGANQAFDPISYLQTMKLVISGFGLDKKIENQLDKKMDNLIAQIKKDKIAKVDKKIAGYLKSAKLSKKHKKIDADDQTTIITMLNNLLDNIK